MTQTVSSTNSQFVYHTSRLQILCTAGTWLTHLLLPPKAALPVWWFACHSGVILKHVWLADSPSTCQGPTILCFEFKVIFIPSPLLPQHLCLHKDVFMYVCMCSGEHREVFFRVGEISGGIWGRWIWMGSLLWESTADREVNSSWPGEGSTGRDGGGGWCMQWHTFEVQLCSPPSLDVIHLSSVIPSPYSVILSSFGTI